METLGVSVTWASLDPSHYQNFQHVQNFLLQLHLSYILSVADAVTENSADKVASITLNCHKIQKSWVQPPYLN